MMSILFPMCVVSLFTWASIVCFIYGECAKGWFYLLSALINVNVLFMK